MYSRHEGIKVGKDENGIFFVIQFTPDFTDKVYMNEFFEDCIESETEIDLKIEPHTKPRRRSEAFYDRLDPKERERIKKDLDLRSFYSPVRDDLNVYNYLMNVYKNNPPSMQYNAKSIMEHKEWANRLVKKVKELVGYPLEDVPMQVEEGPETEFKNLVLKKYYITTAKYLKVPAILARPKKIDKKLPGIICVHGHNKGKINTVGMEESSSNSYYGMDLALRGNYVTLSLDQWGWGERRGQNIKLEDKPEEVFAKSALLLGFTAIGIRSWEVTKSIDFLEQFDFVDNKFGVIGQSGGGTTAAFSSVLEPRINATVISGYFCSWLQSIFAMNHCSCNFIPGILKYADLPDIIATRAPKPTFIVAGEYDPIFPKKGVLSGYELLKEVYSLYSKQENLDIDIVPNVGHVFRGTYAYPWLDKVFGLNSK
ncbi:MAG: hypothetical protein GF364_15955 [Candidatus Lokiarchaeota archaeon]|nr:hypothetical protein [Candidatus Lokiarchaeota archaeon]